MYLDNKYTRWYYNIINAAKLRQKISGYTEEHHIIPESLGGLDTKENLVDLTAKEHYTVHHLLIKMLTGSSKYKMIHAYHRMTTSNDIKVTNAQYEIAKKLKSEMMSELHRDKNSYINSVQYRKKQNDGKNKPEVKKKQSDKMKRYYEDVNSVYNTPEYIEKHKKSCNTNEFKQRLSEVRRLSWADSNSKYNNRPDGKRIPPLNNKTCRILTPDGHVVITDKLKDYCIDNNLNYTAMMAVARGKQKQHKKYTCQWI